MNNEQKGRARRVDLSLKVRLNYADQGTFEERFAKNISRSGIFIRSKEPPAVGTRVRFEYALEDGTRVLNGLGIVRRVRPADGTENSEDPPGMGIEFIDLDAQTEELITTMVSRFGEGERAFQRQRQTFHAEFFEAQQHAQMPADTEFDAEEQEALLALVGKSSDESSFNPGFELPLTEGPISVQGNPNSTAALETLKEAENNLDSALEFDGSSAAPHIGELAAASMTTGAPEAQPPAPPLDDLNNGPALEFARQASHDKGTSPAAMPMADELTARPELVLDLSGSVFGAAVLGHGRTAEHRLALRLHNGAPCSENHGFAVGDLQLWLGSSQRPVWRAIVARRLGFALETPVSGEDSGSGLTLRKGDFVATVGELLELFIEQLLAPYTQSHPSIPTRVVLPANLSKIAEERIAQALRARGFTQLTLQTSSEAVLNAAAMHAPGKAMVLEIGLACTRISVVQEGQPPCSMCEADASFLLLDRKVARHAALLIYREFEIDVEDDASLFEALVHSVSAARRQLGSSGGWHVGVAGAEVELSFADIAKAGQPVVERLLLSMEEHCKNHDIALESLERIVVAADELLWSGLALEVEHYCARPPTVLEMDPWGRIGLPCRSPHHQEPPNPNEQRDMDDA